MGDIDWDKLYHATSEDCKPTPGYLFDEIVRNVTFADMSQIPAVAGYLSGCVDGDHAHVKLKVWDRECSDDGSVCERKRWRVVFSIEECEVYVFAAWKTGLFGGSVMAVCVH